MIWILEMGKRIRELNIDKHFDVFHISAETKLVKPEIKAFNKLNSEVGF